jgi:hypothetical protein
MGGFAHRQSLQPQITPQPVIGVDHQVAGRQGAGFRDDIGRLAPLARARQPVAKHVLFGNKGQAFGFKPPLQRQHGPQNGVGLQALGFFPVLGGEHR